MSRRNLTSNKRSFRKNNRVFLNKVTEGPINLTIDDGVNPPYTVTVDPNTSKVTSSDAPPSVSTGVDRPTTPREQDENLQEP